MIEPRDTPLRPWPQRAVVPWHDVECGAYTADLPLWEELVAHTGGPVLELGCGTGRVALHLARRGQEVWGVDREPGLLKVVERRAAAAGVNVHTVPADVTEMELGRRFALLLAPMQLVQTLDGEPERQALLENVARHLEPGGLAALTLLEEPLPPTAEATPVSPDVREVDGRTYSSLPIEVRLEDGVLTARRFRQVLAPNGELEEESVHEDRFVRLPPERLEREAARAGLRPAGRRQVAQTAEHAGSVVVLLEVVR